MNYILNIFFLLLFNIFSSIYIHFKKSKNSIIQYTTELPNYNLNYLYNI